MEPNEIAETALRRELQEELDYSPKIVTYFTSLEFDFECLGAGRCVRPLYEIQLPRYRFAGLRLAEGRSIAPLDVADLLLEK